MLTVLSFITVLLNVSYVENLYFCDYLAFVLLSRITIAIRIGNAKARASAVFIEGRRKAKTLAQRHLLTLLIGSKNSRY